MQHTTACARPRRWWRQRLVVELALVLVIKTVALFSIKAIWFTAPTVPPDGVRTTEARLLGPASSTAESFSPRTKESAP